MRKRTWIIIIVAVVLIGILVGAKKAGWIGQPKGTEVTLAKAVKADIIETVIASGKIQPEIEVKMSSEVSGEIIELPVEEGQKVEKGQLLVRINPDIYYAAVNRAKASVNAAKAALQSAKAQFTEADRSYKRNQELSKKNVISAAEFDAIERAYNVARLSEESARFQLASAEATLKEAQDNLARTTIYAPQAGTISMLNAEVGERVVGTAQMAGTEILRLANLEYMEVLVEVNENDIIRVQLNDTAIIEVDAYLDKEFRGVVTEIANSAKLVGGSTDQVTNFEVKVRMLKSSYQDLMDKNPGMKSPFRPGMTASVEIITERLANVLTVPIEAVTTRNDTVTGKNRRLKADEEALEDFEVVFVKDGSKAMLRTVKTGIQDSENIHIISGLKEGEEVISGPYSEVSKRLKNKELIVLKNNTREVETDEEEEDE
jgi:HlyD family secretion protein